MIKKITMTIAMFLVALLALAQSDATISNSTAAAETGVNLTTAATDTIQVITETNDTIQALINSATVDRYAEMVNIDNECYILKDGRAFRLDDFDELIGSAMHWHDEVFDSSEQKMLVPVLAICFGVPCFTLIVALVLLLLFFMRRTQARNEIIGKAIDANYPLPDAFFSNQSASQTYDNYPETEQGNNTGLQSRKLRRDPRNFSSAVTLLAVGLALILFFAVLDRWSVAFLAGGIPFFLGIGKLIGYYYVPGFSADDNSKRKSHGYQAPQHPYEPYNQPYRNAPQSDRNATGAYPPPFNPRRNDNPSTPR